MAAELIFVCLVQMASESLDLVKCHFGFLVTIIPVQFKGNVNGKKAQI
jgi:hypothetical protein